MSSRQTMITIGVAVVAFVIAFAAGKAGGGDSQASAAPVGKTISAPAAVSVTSGVSPEALPALKAVKKKKPKKSTPKSNPATPANPTPTNPTPTNPTPTNPTPAPTVVPSNPAPNPGPSNPPAPNPTPVTGGGET